MSVLNVAAYPERKILESGKTTELRAAVRIVASGAKVEDARPPLACALVLDVSGSMIGEPIAQLIQSVEKLCEIAQPTDQLAIIAFSNEASEIAPLTSMTTEGRKRLQSRARRLLANGGTNIAGGLRMGAATLQAVSPETRKSVLLLSDGQPNVGEATPEALGALAATCRPAITVSTLGYGAKHADDVMIAMAEAGGGKFRYIDDPVTCRRELAGVLGAQSDTVASAIECRFILAEGVEIRRFVGSPSVRFSAGAVVMPLADMEDQAQQLIGLELALTKPPPANGRLLEIEVHHKQAANEKAFVERVVLVVDVAATAGDPDPEALAYILLARAEEARKEARRAADAGNFGTGAAILRGLMAEIARAPGFVENNGAPLAEAYELLLDEAVAFERNPSNEVYSQFKKQTASSRLDRDGASSLAPRQGKTEMEYTSVTAGSAPPAFIEVLSGGDPGRYRLSNNRSTIGRTPTAEVVVRSSSVSRQQAEILVIDGEYWLRQTGGSNPTLLNGVRLSAPQKLVDGDEIRIVDVQLRFSKP